MTISGKYGGISEVTFDWLEENACIDCQPDPYDEDGYLVNIMYQNDIKRMDDRDIPTHWEMIPADEEGKKTVINVLSATFNDLIPDKFFSQQNMQRVR